INLFVADPPEPSSLGSPLAVPTQYPVTALDPASASNTSNYELYQIGPPGAPTATTIVNFSNKIQSAAYTDLSTLTRNQTNDWFVGKVALTFASGLPAGRYVLIAHTPFGKFKGITDAAGNPLLGGVQDYTLTLDVQPEAPYVTST